ncbi:putative LysM domain protein [Sarocladium strictum]
MKLLWLVCSALATCLADAYLVAPPGAPAPGAISSCSAWVQHSYGLTCDMITRNFGMTFVQFEEWNPSVSMLDNDCDMIKGLYYCVEINYISYITSTTASQTTTTSSSATVTTKTTTTTSHGNGIATPSPVQPGIVSNCNKFHVVKDTTTCQGIADYNKISLADFLKWNPGINSGCTNLWLGYYTCVGVVAGATTTTSKPPSTTSAGNVITTPSPTQPGMVSNCNKFHLIKDTTTCQGIADYNKISLADFFKWNPSVNSGCTNLWLGAYACAGIVQSATTTSKPPATTTSGNGIPTPSPTQPGMVRNCNKFHLIRETTTCQGIVDYNKITMANFRKWNTGINSDCTNLWLGTYACVGVIS